MMFSKRRSKFLSNSLCPFLASAVAFVGFSVVCYADTSLENKIKDISEEKKVTKNKIKNIRKTKAEKNSLVKKISEREREISEKVSEILRRVEELQVSIEQKEKDIEILKKELEKCYEDLRNVLSRIDKSNEVANGLDVLFGTENANRNDDDNKVVCDSLSELGHDLVEKTTKNKKNLEEGISKIQSEKENLKTLQDKLTKEGDCLNKEKKSSEDLLESLNKEEKEAVSVLDKQNIEENRLRAKLYESQRKVQVSKNFNVNFDESKGYIWPVKGCYTTSSTFGMRGGRMHRGIDIPVAMGTAVMAAADGIVVAVGHESGGWGNYVMISHGGDKATLSAHASDVLVAVGDRVKRGQVVALSGNTGRSTGPHLHFETWNRGVRYDPMVHYKR